MDLIMEAPARTNLYELRDVRRSYRTGAGEVHALDGIDLVIEPGELLAVEGPSGSGKSTLLQLLGGLDRATGGSLEFKGRNLSGFSERDLTALRSRDIGFVFQSFNLIPTLTAFENIEAALVPQMSDRVARRQRVVEVLDQVGLASRADHLPSRLSGGEQQRVAIARALANAPSVILADEPTGNLDSGTAEEIVAVLRTLSADQGVTVVLVTHSNEVADRANRRIALRDGRVISDAQRKARSPVRRRRTPRAEAT
jgi:putative ABC transport system ATP-binding protein